MYFDILEIMDESSDRPRRRQNGPSLPPGPNLPAHLAHMEPFFPGQPKSLSGIALRAFCLGLALATGIIATGYLVIFSESPGWRVPLFLVCLSTFHFLEFWTTAERNTLVASIDSFLLMSNGLAYAVAHAAAFTECAVVSVFFPGRAWLPQVLSTALLGLGLTLVVVGQVVRSAAMMHAGVSFNHQVQTYRADTHALVTDGIYSMFRHPSYFGFFWWGLGTQLVLGNVVCFIGYAVVLWRFFYTRIRHEEENLMRFFGDEYVKFRERVPTRIPFIK